MRGKTRKASRTRIASAFLGILFLAVGLQAARIGKDRVIDPAGTARVISEGTQRAQLAYLAGEIRKGNLVLTSTQKDKLSAVEHRRYRQTYVGLTVFGGEVIEHVKDGLVLSYDGNFFRVPSMSLSPKLTMTEAFEAMKTHLGVAGLGEDRARTELCVFPLSDSEFCLAYRMIATRPDRPMFNETVLLDAATGQVLLEYPNIHSQSLTIGFGTGARGDPMKFPTTLSNGVYYMMDQTVARPFQLQIFNAHHSYGGTIYISTSNDNTWPRDNIVNIYTYIGYAYDLFWQVFGLNGVNNGNRSITAFAHVYSASLGLYDNAFWNPASDMYGQGLYFLDPRYTHEDTGAAIDTVGHEYAHAVTTYHANLIYQGESGALNESFSDIIGTTLEHTFQPEGTGYNMADWYHGEDGNSPFTYSGCRCQSNPNVNSQLKNAGFPPAYWYPDPCNIRQKVPTLVYNGKVVDYDNVHINSTIYPHAFYLLANGGTNSVSGLSVTGVGLEKAGKIFYNAWANHMTTRTDFLGAANALLRSADEIYGSGAELDQTAQMLRAIGYIVN